MSKRLFGMSEKTWDRHANPWSVWTRFATLPFVYWSIWEKSALLFIVLAVWLCVNPKAFPKPKKLDSWASRSVLGERIWLQRTDIDLPERVLRLPRTLLVVGTICFLASLYFCWNQNYWPTIYYATLVYVCKLWFLDRMVYLHQEFPEKV